MTGPRLARVDEYKKKRIWKLSADGVNKHDIAKMLELSPATVDRIYKVMRIRASLLK